MADDVLLEEYNPYGNIQAVVEVSSGACYFYLVGDADTDFGTHSVWVRNLTAAPERLDVEAMRAGQAPLNPRVHTRDPRDTRAPRAADLRVVWLPEGNGAALFERDALLAIIPPWSGVDGFHGYASACVGEGPVAWEIPREGEIVARFREAERFWKAWDDETIWPTARDDLMHWLESALGRHSNYYGIDGGQWPPKAMLRIPRPDGTVLVTAGVSLLPQPGVELYADGWKALRRIELGAVLPLGWPEDSVKRFGAYLSGQSRLPWRGYTWLGPGHTIPCDSWRNREFTAALLVHRHPAIGPIPSGELLGDPVSVLWVLPITEADRQVAIDDGSTVLEGRIGRDRWTRA
jgi:hypothetical protein